VQKYPHRDGKTRGYKEERIWG